MRGTGDVSFWPIVLQKSKVAGLKILRENTKQRAIADSYDLNRVTEVACEFCVRACPSHLVRESRARGPQIFGHRRKSTFATTSANSRPAKCDWSLCKADYRKSAIAVI